MVELRTVAPGQWGPIGAKRLAGVFDSLPRSLSPARGILSYGKPLIHWRIASLRALFGGVSDHATAGGPLGRWINCMHPYRCKLLHVDQSILLFDVENVVHILSISGTCVYILVHEGIRRRRNFRIQSRAR